MGFSPSTLSSIHIIHKLNDIEESNLLSYWFHLLLSQKLIYADVMFHILSIHWKFVSNVKEF